MSLQAPTTKFVHSRASRRTILLATSFVLGFSLTACSSSGGDAADTTCPTGAMTTSVYVDATGSTISEQNKSLQLDVINRVVHRTALCGGTITVEAFGSSSGQTAPIYLGTLAVDAPTENAKRRKAEKLARDVSAEIRNSYDDTLSRVPASATDVVGLLRLIKEALAQQPDAMHEVLILTDGFTNVGVDPSSAPSTQDARSLADSLEVSDLSGVTLRIVGVGRSTTEVPSAVIERVTAFWEQLCERTGASCMVATNWQG